MKFWHCSSHYNVTEVNKLYFAFLLSRSVIEVRDGLTFLDLIVIQIEVRHFLYHSVLVLLSCFLILMHPLYYSRTEPQQQVWLQGPVGSHELV